MFTVSTPTASEPTVPVPFVTLVGVALVCLMLALSGCSSRGDTSHVSIQGGPSIRFTADDIRMAEGAVVAKFSDFQGCSLTRLWYDEDLSELEYGTDTNRIVLQSEVHVNSIGGDGSFTPNTDVTFSWQLSRLNSSGPWTVTDYGQG